MNTHEGRTPAEQMAPAADRARLRQEVEEGVRERDTRRGGPIPTTPEERTEAEQKRSRAQRAATTLRIALESVLDDEAVFRVHGTGMTETVTVSFPTTDAFLAALRLVQLQQKAEPPAGEGEPEHYEAVDAEAGFDPDGHAAQWPDPKAEYDRKVGAAMSEPALPGYRLTGTAPAWPPAAERRLPDREPTLADWQAAHRAARLHLGRSAHWDKDRDLLRSFLPEDARRYVERGARLREETGRRAGW